MKDCPPDAIRRTPSGEVYIADLRDAPAALELSSSIELQPDGRFVWQYRSGQLVLSARGEWERESDGQILLSNPEQVGQPQVEISASSRDPADIFRVLLEPATARMSSALLLELEYPGNYFATFPFEEGVARITDSERPIALRLVSDTLSFYTFRIELAPDGDNVLTLRLIPADLGQAFFSSQRNPFDANGMRIHWLNADLRYYRTLPPRSANSPPAEGDDASEDLGNMTDSSSDVPE